MSSLYQSYISRMLISAKKDKEKESWVGGAHSLPPKPLHSWASVSETLVSFQPTSNQFQAPMRYVCKKKKKREKNVKREVSIFIVAQEAFKLP